MGRYILKRILWLIPVILGVGFLIFTIMFFVPGDPAAILLGGNASAEEVAMTRASLGLDDPYLSQLFNFFKGMFTLNFGTSFVYGTDVAGDLFLRFPKTMILAIFSCIISFTLGVALGIAAAVHQNSWADRFCMLVSMTGVSMPSFWVALMLVILFSVYMGILPPFGDSGPVYFILPAMANCLGGIAGTARQTRSSVLEVWRADFVVTARAKGQSEKNIIFRHILPNALIPIITFTGNNFGGLLAGSLVIETIFSIAGIGTYMISAINNRDYPGVRGSIVFCAVTFGIVMLAVDLIYAYVDPRIKARYEGQKRRKAV